MSFYINREKSEEMFKDGKLVHLEKESFVNDDGEIRYEKLGDKGRLTILNADSTAQSLPERLSKHFDVPNCVKKKRRNTTENKRKKPKKSKTMKMKKVRKSILKNPNYTKKNIRRNKKKTVKFRLG